MEQYLKKIGITSFKDASYQFEPVMVNLFDDGEEEMAIEIVTYKVNKAVKCISVYCTRPEEDFEILAFSAEYKRNKTLSVKTETDLVLGEIGFFSVDLEFDNSDIDAVYNTWSYEDSVTMLKELIGALGKLTLTQEEPLSLEKELEDYEALERLKVYLEGQKLDKDDYEHEADLESHVYELVKDFVMEQDVVYKSCIYKDVNKRPKNPAIWKDTLFESQKFTPEDHIMELGHTLLVGQ